MLISNIDLTTSPLLTARFLLKGKSPDSKRLGQIVKVLAIGGYPPCEVVTWWQVRQSHAFDLLIKRAVLFSVKIWEWIVYLAYCRPNHC
jgi:hypothetical protein